MARNYAREQTKVIFESAQRAGINVYMMRPGERLALGGGSSTSDPNAVGPDGRWFTSLPHETGGEAFLGVGDPRVAETAAARIFEAMSSYYMLGYTSADIEKFHFIKVLVDRPGAEARTRDKYYVPAHEKEAKGPPPPATVGAMAGLLPKSDIPLRVTVAPFAAVPEIPHLGVALAPPSGKGARSGSGDALRSQAPRRARRSPWC